MMVHRMATRLIQIVVEAVLPDASLEAIANCTVIVVSSSIVLCARLYFEPCCCPIFVFRCR